MTPKVPDYGHRYADKKLVALLRRLRLSYLQASISLQQKIDDYMEQFEKEDAMMRALYDSGELSHEDFLKWRQKAVMETQQWKDMREQLTNDLMNQDRIATDIINDALPEVYAENHNYGTYEAEVGSGIDTTYTMYDKNTVARLLRENQDLLPNYHKPDLDISKDKLWNRQHIQSAVLQGILTGEPMGDIAKRFQNVVGMDERAAMRNARTAVTGAENAGRIDSYIRAEKMGIKMQQMWMATLDGRTRDSHAIMDGEHQEVGKKFSNGCRYPGDPQGAPAEIYNCRCTLVAVVEGADPYNPNLRASDYLKDEGLTYEQWQQMHGDRFYSKLFKDYGEPKAIPLPNMVFDGVNENIAQHYTKTISELCKEYPLHNIPLESITDFRTAWNLPKDMELYEFTDEHVDWEGIGGIFYPTSTNYPNGIKLDGAHIILYSAEESDPESLSVILGQLADIRERNGWKDKKDSFFNTGIGLEGMIWHEYGHAVANDCGLYYGQENYELLNDIFKNHTKDEISRDISIYATVNPEEMLAEAFVAYQEPRLRTPLVNEIMDLIHTLRSQNGH